MKKQKNKNKIKSSTNSVLSIMCIPAILLLLVFNYIPMFGVIIAFKQVDYRVGILGSKWIGFKNFEFFFKSNDMFRVLRNTIGMNFLFIIVGTCVSILFALLLYEITNKHLIKIYQTILFLPYFLSMVVVAFLAYTFLSYNYGIINSIVTSLGFTRIDFYNEARFWPVILVFISVWKGLGMGCMMYYATLMGVDTEYFDAAAIDGANKVQTIFYISLPFLRPMITILLILSIGGIMNSDFGLFYLVTQNSGTLYKYTDTIDTYLYRALIVTGNTGISAAVGLFQSAVGFILVLQRFPTAHINVKAIIIDYFRW